MIGVSAVVKVPDKCFSQNISWFGSRNFSDLVSLAKT